MVGSKLWPKILDLGGSEWKWQTVRWLSVDGHSVDCHVGRMLLVCHLCRNVINVDTYVDCRLRRIVANSSLSDVLSHSYCTSHSYK
jgi:hypothetical protein